RPWCGSSPTAARDWWRALQDVHWCLIVIRRSPVRSWSFAGRRSTRTSCPCLPSVQPHLGRSLEAWLHKTHASSRGTPQRCRDALEPSERESSSRAAQCGVQRPLGGGMATERGAHSALWHLSAESTAEKRSG